MPQYLDLMCHVLGHGNKKEDRTNEWADENGDLGPVYGYQWRSESIRSDSTYQLQ